MALYATLQLTSHVEVQRAWRLAEPNVARLFDNDENSAKIQPSLLHGDLWFGNAAQLPVNEDLAPPCTEKGQQPAVVVFDPACFYGHHEFDLAASLFFTGGPRFSRAFYDAYHAVIPKADGFDTRQKLYQLVI